MVNRHAHALPTPTIRCCPRRWRNGASAYFRRSFRAIFQIILEINKRFLEQVEAQVARAIPR
mgnify:CR=1 FL=1